jgi:hypothetical protein
MINCKSREPGKDLCHLKDGDECYYYNEPYPSGSCVSSCPSDLFENKGFFLLYFFFFFYFFGYLVIKTIVNKYIRLHILL